MRERSDGPKPSPPLGYNLGTPASKYVVERGMSAKGRLFLDVVRYVEKQGVTPFEEIQDSLQLFRIAVGAPNYWRASELYDITWNDAKPRYIFSVAEDVTEISTDDGTMIVAENPRETIRSIDDLITEYGIMEFLRVGPKGALSVPDKDKVAAYPDLRSIIRHLERNSGSSEAQTVLAALYITVDQEDKAVDMYKRILGMKPHDYYNLGVIHLTEEQDYVSAKIRFEEALEIDENLAEARYNLGITYLRREDWQSAAEHFEKLAEACDPDSIEDNLTIDGEEVQLGAGKILMEHAIKQFSCNNLGVCHYHINSDLREALEWFEAASSWRFITELDDGIYNRNYVLKKYQEIAEGPPESPKRKKRQDKFLDIIGNSEAMLAVYDEMEIVVDTDLTVLLTGESGVGKGKVAEEIHKASSRKDKDFIPVESPIADGLFGHEKGAFGQAGGGTIFIREIFDMSEELLPKTLRTIDQRESKKIEARFIMATSKDLELELKEGRLRRELYDLICRYPIPIPPLRDRREDILPLAEHFVKELSIEHGVGRPHLSAHVRDFLQLYDWPGNVQELRNVMERAVVRAKNLVIHLRDLREVVEKLLKESKDDKVKERFIDAILGENGGDVSKAARQMGMHRSWFTRNIKKIEKRTPKHATPA